MYSAAFNKAKVDVVAASPGTRSVSCSFLGRLEVSMGFRAPSMKRSVCSAVLEGMEEEAKEEDEQ